MEFILGTARTKLNEFRHAYLVRELFYYYDRIVCFVAQAQMVIGVFGVFDVVFVLLDFYDFLLLQVVHVLLGVFGVFAQLGW